MLTSALVFVMSIFIVLACLWFVTNYRYYKCLRHIPGPIGLPIIGHALHFTSLTSILPKLMEMKQKYGGMYPIYIGLSAPSLTISDPKFLEFLLGSTAIIEKSSDYRHLHGWLGRGLLTSTGYRWRSHRKIITPAFHFKILESFVDVFEKNCEILIKKFEQEIGKNSFDVYPYVTLLALDIICETALGTEVYAQTNTHSEYVESVKDMCRIIMERTFNPLLQNDFVYKLSSVYKREKKALEILHSLTLSVLQKKRKQLLSNGSLVDQDESFGIKKKLAFLDLLLHSTVDGKPLSDSDLREEVDTFMFEGHDTTASAISFILYMLSKHKDVQDKVMQELNLIYGDDFSRPSNHADLLQMKYLEAVIKETLRLYPSVPLFARQATEDIIYENTLIPRGTRLSIFAFGIMRDPELFPEPEKFDPDRFLYKTGNVQFPYAYIPFSAGPRNCIGQKFAMLEMKATISKILRVYEILPAEPIHELLLSPETTLKSANGIKVKIEKRK